MTKCAEKGIYRKGKNILYNSPKLHKEAGQHNSLISVTEHEFLYLGYRVDHDEIYIYVVFPEGTILYSTFDFAPQANQDVNFKCYHETK